MAASVFAPLGDHNTVFDDSIEPQELASDKLFERISADLMVFRRLIRKDLQESGERLQRKLERWLQKTIENGRAEQTFFAHHGHVSNDNVPLGVNSDDSATSMQCLWKSLYVSPPCARPHAPPALAVVGRPEDVYSPCTKRSGFESLEEALPTQWDATSSGGSSLEEVDNSLVGRSYARSRQSPSSLADRRRRSRHSIHTMHLVEQPLDEPEYDVRRFYYADGFLQGIARSEYFSNLALFVICLNALYMGYDSNENKSDNLYSSRTEVQFQIGENFFAVFFTIEWLVRFGAFRKKMDCLRDAWFKFDSMLVLLILVETWLLPLTLILVGGDSMNLPTGPLRLFRLLRLARMTRLMKALPELITMVRGMTVASRAVGSSFVMIIALIYIFSVAMHSFLKDSELLYNKFGTIPNCMWTLLLDGVFLDNIGEVTLTMKEDGRAFSIILFLIFVLLSSTTVMNMLIGVLCEVVSEVTKAEKESAAINEIKGSLLSLLKKSDIDGTHDINEEELLSVINDPEAITVLEDLAVDVGYISELQDMLFEKGAKKDADSSCPARLPVHTILETILHHRGDLPTTVKHLVDCHTFTQWSMEKALERQTQAIFEQMNTIFLRIDDSTKLGLSGKV